MNRKRQLKRTTRNLRFRPATYDSPDERTPIKLRSQMKEISLEMTPRSRTQSKDRDSQCASTVGGTWPTHSRMLSAVHVVSGITVKKKHGAWENARERFTKE